jgi:hypothetical protein
LICLDARLRPKHIAGEDGLVSHEYLKPLHDAPVRRIVLRTSFKGLQQGVDLSMKVLDRRIVGQNRIDLACSI